MSGYHWILPKHLIVVGLFFCPHPNLASPFYLTQLFKLVKFYLDELSIDKFLCSPCRIVYFEHCIFFIVFQKQISSTLTLVMPTRSQFFCVQFLFIKKHSCSLLNVTKNHQKCLSKITLSNLSPFLLTNSNKAPKSYYSCLLDCSSEV